MGSPGGLPIMAMRRGGGVLLLVVGVLAALALAWSSTGSEWSVVTWWVATVVLGVLAPGWAVVRTVRRGPHAATDLGWAGPTGLVLALATWAVGHSVGLSLPSLLIGPLVVGVLLTVPRFRTRLLDSSLDSSGWWPANCLVGIAAALLVTARWLWNLGLAGVPPEPTAGFPTYHQDLLYQTALTGEARRSLVPTYPMVDGEPLGYHWFLHALAAQLGGSGARDLDLVTRLLPSTLVVLLVLLAAAVGHQVVGRWTGAVGAAAAVAVYHPSDIDPWRPGPVLATATYWQLSPTATLGWVFGLALVGCVIGVLRRGPDDTLAPVVLLVPFAVGAAGAKSAQVPVVIAGVALALLARLIGVLPRSAATGSGWRLGFLRHVLVIATLGVVVALALIFVYPGSYGLRLDPHAWFDLAMREIYGRATTDGTEQAVAVAGSLVRRWVPAFAPCLGLLVLIRRSPLDPSGWIGLGGLVAGLGAVLLLTHPSSSQFYFPIAAVPIAVALSGAGCGWGLQRLGAAAAAARSQTAALVAVLAVTAAAAAVTVRLQMLYAQRKSPLARWRAQGLMELPGWAGVLRSWTAPILLGTAALAFVAVIAWLVLRRFGAVGQPGLFLSLLTLALIVAGTVRMGPSLLQVTATPAALARAVATDNRLGHPEQTTALFEAGNYLRTTADSDDVVATNRIWNGRTPFGVRDNRDFSVAAFSGLRTDVSGYGYAPRMLQLGVEQSTYYVHLPFWDQPRLDAELALITAPTQARLEEAYRTRRIRWILADERSGLVSTQLAALTDVVLHRDGVWLVRLRPPAD